MTIVPVPLGERAYEVRIGHFRQVVPDSMQFSWKILTEGGELDGCELAIEHVPAVVACRHCGQETWLDLPILLWDERWSTQAVERAMIEADVSRARRAEKVDALAAAHILQGAIDALVNLPPPQ